MPMDAIAPDPFFITSGGPVVVGVIVVVVLIGYAIRRYLRNRG